MFEIRNIWIFSFSPILITNLFNHYLLSTYYKTGDKKTNKKTWWHMEFNFFEILITNLFICCLYVCVCHDVSCEDQWAAFSTGCLIPPVGCCDHMYSVEFDGRCMNSLSQHRFHLKSIRIHFFFSKGYKTEETDMR